MLYPTRHSPTASGNRESHRRMLKRLINEEDDPFKGLGDENVEEDAVQNLNADLSTLKEKFC